MSCQYVTGSVGYITHLTSWAGAVSALIVIDISCYVVVKVLVCVGKVMKELEPD